MKKEKIIIYTCNAVSKKAGRKKKIVPFQVLSLELQKARQYRNLVVKREYRKNADLTQITFAQK